MTDSAKKKVDQEDLDIQNVMNSKSGRDFMFRMLIQAGVFSNNFTADPYIHAYNAGIRSQGVWLKDQLLIAAPDNYNLMMKENNNGY